MKYFENGLNMEALTKRYRELAKQYHPDLNPDRDTTMIMQEINKEYDEYYSVARSIETGYNAWDIRNVYDNARKSREIVLAFLRRDKKEGKGFFAFNRYGKISSDESDTWTGFHGGFSVCQLERTSEHFLFHDVATEQKAKRLDVKLECPTYADMYFGLNYGEFESESTAMVDSNVNYGDDGGMRFNVRYELIHSNYYGDIWTSVEKEYGWVNNCHMGYKTKRYAYMKAQDRIMRCPFDLKKEFFVVKESVTGFDFGYLAFQDCTQSQFFGWHDVDYKPALEDALEMEPLSPDDLYWIDDPVVAHFARTGLITFFQSKRNFKMRYGTFNKFMLNDSIHELSIEDAETIQDYLDNLNKDFETASKNMARKGKLKIDTSQKSNRYYY